MNFLSVQWNHRWPKLKIWPSALLYNVQNIRICMGEKTVVCVVYECKRIEIKKRLTSLEWIILIMFLGNCPPTPPQSYWFSHVTFHTFVHVRFKQVLFFIVTISRLKHYKQREWCQNILVRFDNLLFFQYFLFGF